MMPRPARHDRDSLLDSAVALAAARGPAAVSMAEVGRAAGAPSGSVYHRFPSRAALLAELRLRTIGRFQEGFLAALRGEDPVSAAAAAACYVVEWARTHPDEATVLLYAPADFAADSWPREARAREAQLRRELERALGQLARRLGLSGSDGRERLLVATVDLPYAVVRRHLRAPTPIPDSAGRVVSIAARVLLSGAGAPDPPPNLDAASPADEEDQAG
jgi:AcrR family transcriptional regulator